MKSAILASALTLTYLSPLLSSAEEAAVDFDQVYADVLEVVDRASQSALRPATRQEMLLEASRIVLLRGGSKVPPNLHQMLSDAPSQADEKRILSELLAEVTWTEQNRRLFLFGSLAPLRGLARIEKIDDLRVTRQIRENLYVGIGIQISQQADYPVMPKVFPNGPAHKAKAKDGDRIVAVDGESMQGKPLSDVVARLRGPRGEAVDVTLQTADQPPRTVRMVRDFVPIDSVEGFLRKANGEWDYQIPGKPGVALLKILEFKGSTVQEMRTAARRIRKDGFRAVVIDVSPTSVGQFRHAVLLAQLILEDKPLGGKRTRNGDTRYEANPERLFGDMPIAVTISQRTSGVAEWFAATLRDNQRATLVGQKTAGRGMIETEYDLKSGYVLNLVSGHMIRPNGQPLQATRHGQAVRLNPLVRPQTGAFGFGGLPQVVGDDNRVGGVKPHSPTNAHGVAILHEAAKSLLEQTEKPVGATSTDTR